MSKYVSEVATAAADIDQLRHEIKRFAGLLVAAVKDLHGDVEMRTLSQITCVPVQHPDIKILYYSNRIITGIYYDPKMVDCGAQNVTEIPTLPLEYVIPIHDALERLAGTLFARFPDVKERFDTILSIAQKHRAAVS